MDYILKADNVSKVYAAGNRRITVLDAVSLEVRTGEFLVVGGASGSGKTTLLSLLSGLDQPSSGHVFFRDTDLTRMSEDELAPFRNTAIGFVFQSFHLVPSLCALENVSLPAEIRKDPQALPRAESLLEQVGMAHRKDNFPHQLSGGEKQRIAICRALINRPEIIFADEPTGNLDSVNGRAIMELLRNLHEEMKTTLVMVTHVPSLCQGRDRTVLLRDGRLWDGKADSGYW
jgi:putative ABC transport system ATP-binding protein